jgi:hypothetical protein
VGQVIKVLGSAAMLWGMTLAWPEMNGVVPLAVQVTMTIAFGLSVAAVIVYERRLHEGGLWVKVQL